MSFNNAPLIKARLDQEPATTTKAFLAVHPVRRRVVSDPCLPERLPNTSFLHREAESMAPVTLRKELARNDPGPKDPDPETNEIPPLPVEDENGNEQSEDEPPQSPTESQHKPSFFKSIAKTISGFNGNTSRKRPQPVSWSNVQPFEIMRAVEDSDIVFLMEVRDKAFPLLLRTSGGQTPLVHAIRIGKKDVAIVLLGAFSRYINHLEDSDIRKGETQSQLKVLRTGLKLAINQGLANSQPDLIASFMQTLIMSEGDQWVWAQVSMVARELNAGAEGRPVESAGTAVRRFTTRELGKAGLIASLEDYIANATADLLLMGAWSIALQSVPADNLPTYFFARDDRVYKAFTSTLEQHKGDIDRNCPRQLRLQLKLLKEGLEGRQLTFRRKVELLAEKLDSGDPL